MNGNECAQAVANEILKGELIGLGDPLSYPGIVIVPIVKFRETLLFGSQLSRTTLTEDVHKVIVGSIPKETCGVFILDSLGDVIAFKIHQEVATFWERISFVERLVVEHYKDSRKPIGKASATARAVAFLMRLRLEGPKGIMISKSDYFAVSRSHPERTAKIGESLLESTSAIIYCAAR